MTREGRFNCILIGEESLLIQCAMLLHERDHVISAVVSGDAAIRRWCRENEVAVIEGGAGLAERLKVEPFDYLFSITNLSVLPEEVITLPRQGAINFHDGPLPRYAGLNAPVWALLARETEYGITWHRMTAGLDEGEILKQVLFEISEEETSLTLNAKCYEKAIETFAQLVDELDSGSVRPLVQDLGKRSYFARDQRPPAQCVIDWTQPAQEIDALVRALDFGSYANPIGLPKLVAREVAVVVGSARRQDTRSGAAAGAVLEIGESAVRVATGTEDIELTGLRTLAGAPITPSEWSERSGIKVGDTLSSSDETASRFTSLNKDVARYEPFWVRRLSRLDVAELPQVDRTSGRPATHVVQDLSKGRTNVVFGVALVAAYLARVTGRAEFDVGLRVPAAPGDHTIFSDRVPLHLVVDLQQPLHTLVESITQQLESVRKRGTFALDAVARFPQLAGLARDPGKRFPIVLDLVDQVDSTSAARGADLTLGIAPDGTVRLVSESAALSLAEVRGIARQIEQLAAGVAESATRAVGDQPMLTEAELRTVLREWNDTRRDFEETVTIDGLFAAQALRTPDRTALVHRGDRLTYRQLSERAGLLAHHLRGLGVGPDTLVGVCVERSIDLVVAVLGVLKAGGAYVPLDPSYPKDRVAYMIADAGAPVLIAEGRRIPDLPAHNAQVVAIDGAWRNADVAVPQTGSAGPDNLAYVIYTSGSTGRPKGVMVEHRNVLNFFAGMDDRVGADEPGTWLAVTSLSFDISVLELLWTLARGFEVVIHSESDARTRPVRKAAASGRPLDFSFFYFAADAGEGAGDKYRLLLEGARFADRNGFSAVWTPERHFHAFGGLYPNPAVTGAALAAVTERVQIRGGSVVLPLHHPIRVAEEWSVVDNISRGRVGIAFASGWQPNDFVLRPESFGDQKKVLLRDIDVVRRLWRGETLTFPGPKGDVEVRTLPRPIQPELPFWITTAGNPDTFEAAGRVGANILTHLLGQTVEELGEKLAAYRRAWKEAGHAGDGHVSLMLHAFVGEDNDRIREIVRGPLTSYLRTAAGLIRQFASSFPAFKKLNDVMDADAAFRSLSEEEMEALLAHSFERYYETSGLLGPLEKCLEMCERVQAVGVDEIACLIDFGVDHELVLSHLADLDQVRAQSQASVELSVEDYSVGAQIRRHAVTHMQCTPSMAAMLASDPDTRVALAGLKVLMVGGEAFPTALAQDLASLVRGAVINMYGPTETTIWSSTHHVSRDESAVPIGRPIANTSFYVLDARRHPVPIGVPGELYIGGAGVVRGYLNRPELTAERFVADPFANGSGGRLYRTGDLVRYRGDGNVDFLGRIDHQVKIRGYRVELGEIETQIASWDGIREAAVVLREDTEGDKRLVAYYAPTATARIDADALREHLRGHLPEFMVPSHLVELEELPRTPNGKLDRAALPAPKARRSTAEAVTAPPADDTERVIAEIWCSLLDIPEVGVHDNFFDLGGHSLLVVQAHRRLRDTLKVELSLTDLFRFPTIRALSRHLVSEPGSSAADVGLDRAEARKRSMQRRGRTRA